MSCVSIGQEWWTNWWCWCQVCLCLRFWLTSVITACVSINIWIIVTWPSRNLNNVHLCFFLFHSKFQNLWVQTEKDGWSMFLHFLFGTTEYWLFSVKYIICDLWSYVPNEMNAKRLSSLEQHASQNFETYLMNV